MYIAYVRRSRLEVVHTAKCALQIVKFTLHYKYKWINSKYECNGMTEILGIYVQHTLCIVQNAEQTVHATRYCESAILFFFNMTNHTIQCTISKTEKYQSFVIELIL